MARLKAILTGIGVEFATTTQKKVLANSIRTFYNTHEVAIKADKNKSRDDVTLEQELGDLALSGQTATAGSANID